MNKFKGYYNIVKGIVTRTDDPKNLSRIQVCIPSYHGKLDNSESKTGSGDDEGEYPWAQICSVNFKSNNEINLGIQSSLFSDAFTYQGSTVSSDMAPSVIMPDINEVVWLSFEGGDIRLPVYLSTVAPYANTIEYTLPGFEYAFSGYGIIGDSSDGSISGSTLAELAASIIFAEEGGYDSINGNDNGAISIGKVQWHADRARSLLKSIRDANDTKFNNTLSKHGATGLTSDLNMSTWSSYILSSGAPKYNAMKEILGTTESKTEQDKLAISDISGYIKDGRSKGISDPGALIYWADLQNQGGLGGANVCYNASAKPITLETLYNGSLTTYMGQYKSRRDNVYNKIKQLERDGKLSTSNATIITSGTNQGGKFLWPVPGYTYISSYYGYRSFMLNGAPYSDFHDGVDITGPDIDGKPAIAVANGTVSLISSDQYGNTIMIALDNSNFHAAYVHGKYDQRIKPGLKVGDRVKAGQVVHYIGTTGLSTGPHLHFGLYTGAPWGKPTPDPLPYIKG